MNMIRVWGGGFYEQDFFYDLCDELGLLVWQDFMFACNLYPSTPDFLAEVRAEVDHQVRRLGSHASIALWCGDNELIGALNWFEESRRNRDRYLVNYDRLNRTIEEAMRAADPERDLVAVEPVARQRSPSATPGTTIPPATCISGASGTRAGTSSTTATCGRASAPSSASSRSRRAR